MSWISSVWSDFSALQPTSQVSFSIGGLTFLAAVLIGVRKAGRNHRISKKNGSPMVAGESDIERARILKLIEGGKISVKDALKLARLLYGSAAFRDGTSYSESSLNVVEVAQTVSALTGGDEERRAFAKIVTEFATSDDVSDRAVILQYARGDRSAAIATLTARAEAAGVDGAEIWREVATLALPFNHSAALNALQKAAEMDVTDVVSLCRLSLAFSRTGDMDAALKAAEQALERANDDSLRGRALYRLSSIASVMGDSRKAALLAEESVAAARKGAAEHPNNPECARVLANAFEMMSSVHVSLGSHIEANVSLDRAVMLYELVLEKTPDDEEVILDRFRAIVTQGYLDRIAGNPSASVERYEALLPEIAQTASDKHDNLWFAEINATALLHLAYSLHDLGRDGEALEAAVKVEVLSDSLINKDRAQLEARQNRLWAQILRGRILAQNGKIDDALRVHDALIANARKDIPIGTDKVRRNLMAALNEHGNLCTDIGDILGAEESYKEAYEIIKDIAKGDPKNVLKQEDVLLSMWKLAGLAKIQDDGDEYHRLAKEALQMVEDLCQDYPTIRQLKFNVAYGQQVLADACFSLNDEEAAFQHSKAACTQYGALAQANPDDFITSHHAIDSERIHAAYLAHFGRGQEGLALAEKVMLDYKALADSPEKIERLSGFKSICLTVLGAAYQTFGDFEQANQSRSKAVDILRARYNAAPAVLHRRSALVQALINYGRLLLAVDRTEEAHQQFEEALSLCDHTSNTPNREELTNEFVVKWNLERCANILGDSKLAAQLRKECLLIAEQQALVQSDITAQSNLTGAYSNEASVAMRVGRWRDAEEWLAKAHKAAKKVSSNPKKARLLRKALVDQELDVANNLGDKLTMKQHINTLVELAEEDEAIQSTLVGRFELCDLLLRQAAVHNEIGVENKLLPKVVEALQAAEDSYLENELARQKLVPVWKRVGHLHAGNEQYSLAIVAFKKSLNYLSKGDEIDNALEIANLRVAMAEVYFALEEIDNAKEELVQLDELIPIIRAKYDLPKYAIHQEFGAAHQRARIALFSGLLSVARKQTKAAEQAARALDRELPDHAQPVMNKITVLELEIEALAIEQKMDAAGEVIEKFESLLLDLREVVDNNDTIAITEGYLDLWRSQMWNALGQYTEALAIALNGIEMMKKQNCKFSTAFRVNLLGRLRQSAAEAANLLGEHAEAIDLQRQANVDFHFLTDVAPETKEHARNYLRGLYEFACITENAEDFEAVAHQKTSLEASGKLPKHLPWVVRLQTDGRINEVTK